MSAPLRSCQQATRPSVRASCSPRTNPVSVNHPIKIKAQQISSAACSSVLAISLMLSGGGQAHAESLPAYQAYELLPKSFEKPAELAVYADSQKKLLADVDSNFENSDTLKRLKEQSAANKEKNAKAIAKKYCIRQAEMGVGDCGGLNFVPGLTQNGVQRPPKWLTDILGVKNPDPVTGSRTLEELFDKAE